MAGSLLAAAFATVVVVTPESLHADSSALRAQALVDRGAHVEARALLEESVAAGSADAAARLLLGRLLLGDAPQRSRSLAAEVLRADPRDRSALDLLSASHARARALGLSRAGELAIRRLEIADYEQLLSRRPEDPELRYRRGSQQVAVSALLAATDLPARARALDAAVADLERALDALDQAGSAERASARFQLGLAHHRRGDLARETGAPGKQAEAHYRDALAAYGAALDADPDRVDAVSAQAQVLLSLGDAAGAEARVRAAAGRGRTRLAPAKTRVMLAELLLGAGRAGEALAELEAALAEEPRALDGYLVQWKAQVALGRDRAGREALEAGLAVEPRFVDALLQLGQAAVSAGRPEDAYGHFQRILAIPEPEAVSLGMRPSVTQY